MVEISETGFGYIVIDGRRYSEDIVLCGDKVFERPKYLSRKYRETYNHTPLSREEVAEILGRCPGVEAVVIGTGQYGALPVMDEAISYLREQGIEYYVDKTPRAIDYVRNLARSGRRFLAILHLTC